MSLARGSNVKSILDKSVMRKLKAEFKGFFAPKDAWFVLPLFMVDYNYGRLTIGIGWLRFGVGLEIRKEDE